MPSNDNSAELRREKRLLLGKIERRRERIISSRADIDVFSARVAVIEETLRERGHQTSPKRPATT